VSKTTFDVTKWIGDLKKQELTAFVFNQTLIFDDVQASFTQKYNVQEILKKDISAGAGDHHASSNL
jgi:hypothetical protein